MTRQKFCPYCEFQVLRYDERTNAYFCLECEHVEVAPVRKVANTRTKFRPGKTPARV